MEFIDINFLQKEKENIKRDFNSKVPFRYTTFEGVFLADKADEILAQYPTITNGKWDGTTYVDQKNKFSKTTFDENSVLDRVFKELNSKEFLAYLEEVTGIQGLEGDAQLFGGGLHQSIKGAFLNVHVDYNFHPETKYHRRLNVIVYMNKDWKDEYEGHLELWDLQDGKKQLIGKYAPTFNRCVIFETNEISFHGHPHELKAPEGINRKSLAVYYYTPTRPDGEIAHEHNTIYVNTTGANGQFKRFRSGLKALFERVTGK
jgi:Rps23 Pro-64 3,4-dihydroxylase Tpa1-like proline 4-hydroxylase